MTQAAAEGGNRNRRSFCRRSGARKRRGGVGARTFRVDPQGGAVAHLETSRFRPISVLGTIGRNWRDDRNPKFAAILDADVVGFNRLTGADEDGASARLRALAQSTELGAFQGLPVGGRFERL